MKKFTCLLIAAMLLMTACGGQQEVPETTVAQQVTAQIAGAEVVFEPWVGEGIPTEGRYHLTQDVELAEPLTVSGKLELHLNGYRVTGASGVSFGSLITVAQGGELVICDAPEGTGAIVSPRSYSGKPRVLHVIQVEGKLTVAGGTVDASAINLENIANGACVYVCDGGVAEVAGGVLVGGTTICYSLDPEKNTVVTGEDPNATTETTVPAETTAEEVVTEEVIVEEEELPRELLGKGGTVYICKGGSLTLSSGEIRSGIAGLGGNIYVEGDETAMGELVITGGTVTDGEAMFHGGNIYIDGALRMSDGEITLGRAYGNGGNIMVTGTLEVTRGTISDGRCDFNGLTGKRGGNILVNGLNAVVHIANAQILGGDGQGKENFGGNICVMGQCAREFTVEDTVITGGLGHRGGNLYFGTLAKDVNMENLDFYMRNVTISEGSCSYRGANLCMDSDLRGIYVNLVMDNCSMLLSEAGQENVSLGAGAAVDTWATLTMNGGKLDGGSLTIYADATLTLKGTEKSMDSSGGPGNFVVIEE